MRSVLFFDNKKKMIYGVLLSITLMIGFSNCRKSTEPVIEDSILITGNTIKCGSCLGFGRIIEIQDNLMAIAENESLFLFERNNNTWHLVQTIKYNNTSGIAKVVLLPNTIFIGRAEANGDGKVEVLKKSTNGLWSISQSIYKGLHQDYFGNSIHVLGDRMIVGAQASWNDSAFVIKNEDIGHAYVYKLENDSWIFESELKSVRSAKNDWFGRAVYLIGSYALVSDKTNSLLQVFKRDQTTWQFYKLLNLESTKAIDGFDNELIVVGYNPQLSALTLNNEGEFVNRTIDHANYEKEFADHGEILEVFKDYALIATENSDNCFLYKFEGNKWVSIGQLPNTVKYNNLHGLAISNELIAIGGSNIVNLYSR